LGNCLLLSILLMDMRKAHFDLLWYGNYSGPLSTPLANSRKAPGAKLPRGAGVSFPRV